MVVDRHAGSPAELKARLEAERHGNPFLVYRDGEGIQRVFALGGSGRVTVGRRPENDLALCFDPSVSRVYVALEPAAGEWTLADEGLSSNGSYVNGERVLGRRRLRDGDLVRCGETALANRAPGRDPDPTAVRATAAVAPALSATQRRVLVALCRPCMGAAIPSSPASNREIADELCLSVEAVKAHLRALFSMSRSPTSPTTASGCAWFPRRSGQGRSHRASCSETWRRCGCRAQAVARRRTATQVRNGRHRSPGRQTLHRRRPTSGVS